MNIKQIDFLRIFKIAAAASIGCLLAVLFQLQTPTSAGIIAILSPVSYTHLDVYKRQEQENVSLSKILAVSSMQS